MFAYIPDNLLLIGLKLGEFKYKDLEPSIRAKKEFIDVALSVSVNNFKYVPKNEVNSVNFDFNKSLDEAIESNSVNKVSEILQLGQNHPSFDTVLNKNKMLKILTLYYFDGHHWEALLKVLPKSCLFFNDLNFMQKIFKDLEKDDDISIGSISSLYNKMRSYCEKDLYKNSSDDLFFAKYSIFNGVYWLSENIRHDNKLFLDFLNYCSKVKKDDFQENFINFLNFSNLKTSLKALTNPEVVARVIDLSFNDYKKKPIDLDVFDYLFKKIPKSLILNVIKILIDKGYVFSFCYSDLVGLNTLKSFYGFDVVLNNSIGWIDNYVIGLLDDVNGKLRASKKEIADAKFILENLDFNKMPEFVFKDISNVLLDDDGICLALKVDSKKFVYTRNNIEELVKKLLKTI